MAKDPHQTEKDAVRAALQQVTHEELARRMGIATRTLTRFLNREGEPSRLTVSAVRRWIASGHSAGQVESEIPATSSWSPNPALKGHLPPRAYEVALGYLKRLERAMLSAEQLEEAERLLIDGRYATLNKRIAGRALSEDEHIMLVDATWAVISESLAISGKRV